MFYIRSSIQKTGIAIIFLLLIIFLNPVYPAAGQTRIQATDAATRLEWFDTHLQMRQASEFKDLPWRFIGPEIMSGRIVDVAIPPERPFTIYAATASGGAWKTKNEGTTWQPILDNVPSASVGDIAVAPSDPDIVWVGLGEANILRSSMAGTGVYRSLDAGKTWQHMGLAETHHIARIIIHPQTPEVVYVAASGHEYTYNEERGVYKTLDGGNNWEKVLYFNEKTGAIDLVMDPSDSDTLFMASWNRIRRSWRDPKVEPGNGIYKTTDGGKNWRPLTNGLPPSGRAGRIGIDIAAGQPNVIYAFFDMHNLGRAPSGAPEARDFQIIPAAVFRSENAGETWSKVSQDDRILQRLVSTFGWFFGQIRVDPNDEDTLYILGVPMLKSTDGGKTYNMLRYPGLHGDHHALWIDPSDSSRLINGNDGGINVSYDEGQTWKNLLNLGAVQFYNLYVDMAQPFNCYGSIQDNGCYRGPVTHQPGQSPAWEWESIPGGEASYIALHPNNPNILFTEGYYGRMIRSDWKNGKWEQKNIAPEKSIGPESGQANEPKLRGQWLTPFVFSVHKPEILYHGRQYLLKSIDYGDSWQKISPDLTYNDPAEQDDISFATITTISESPKKFGLIYIGTDDGKVQVTRDEGRTWKEVMAGLPYKKWVSRIIASAYSEGTVYLTLNGKRDNDFEDYIYRSTDYGETWVDISANIPGGPVNVIREDPKKQEVLYVGTDLGVYVSVNSGMDWQVLGSGLPITFVHDLIVHPRDNILVIATHGRGMWTIDDVTVVQDQAQK